MLLLIGCAPSSIPLNKEEPLIIDHDDPTFLFIVPEMSITSSTLCPADMAYIQRGKSKFCIDLYEAPNVKGAYPLYAQTAYDGNKFCVTKGKKLCSEDEWYFACVGPKWTRFPYGNDYVKGICNDDKTNYIVVPWNKMGSPEWQVIAKMLYKADPSGNRKQCVTPEGVYDLMGNVAEWVKSGNNEHGYVVMGGFWYGVYGGGIPNCGFVNPAHAPGFNSYEFGFRCCKDV